MIPSRHSPYAFTSDIAKSKVREHGSDSVTLESATFDDDERDTRSNTSAMQPTHTISSRGTLATRSSVSARRTVVYETEKREALEDWIEAAGSNQPLRDRKDGSVLCLVEAIEQRSCSFSAKQSYLLCPVAGMRRKSRRTDCNNGLETRRATSRQERARRSTR